MSDVGIAWAVFAPLLVGGTAWLLYPLNSRLSDRGRSWLGMVTLLLASAALLVGPVVLAVSTGETSLPAVGLTLAVTPLARLGLVAANAAIFCMLIAAWPPRPGFAAYLAVSAAMLASGLLACALLTSGVILTAFCLFAVALLVGIVATVQAAGSSDDASLREERARRLTGALKHLALAAVVTVLLVAGGLLVARYPYNQENVAALQTGLGLLVIGLVVRAGAMPFAGANADLVESAPSAAILALGATVPVVIVVGLLILRQPETGPVSLSETSRQVALWIAVIGALLAGLRALGARERGPGVSSRSAGRPDLPVLVACSAALQTGWALFGVLSGSRPGADGAALLAVNIALAVPLVVVGSRLKIQSSGLEEASMNPALAVGAASLLGLPPFGGFVGCVLVAQAAAEVNGWLLAALLLGSTGVAIAWLRAVPSLAPEQAGTPNITLRLLAWALVGAQLVLLVLSVVERKT
jgi:NADH:ubiquinone oxidoreductase subunit 2 (subunit N)